jgi:glycosyltransferase involved in cell wall biosynthesis/DNA-directed RNA polymerase subunit RPC12/RpoP
MDLTSIIIPGHNENRSVQRTVDSIFANTERDSFEIILLDDGSTDGSFEFLDRNPYKDDARIHSYRFDQPQGCIHARHHGVNLAKGDVIVFLDAHMALTPNWLKGLKKNLVCWGWNTAVSPDITALDEEQWVPEASSGYVMSIDSKLNMVWGEPPYPTGLVPTFVGCCILLPRSLYYQAGGFDLGLRLWGCEFIDLCIKIYRSGGMCLLEPSVLAGHLFRDDRPYPMSYRDINYNKLRTGYIHLDTPRYNLLTDLLRDEPEFDESISFFEQDLPEIDRIRQDQLARSERPPDWFANMFLNSRDNDNGNNNPVDHREINPSLIVSGGNLGGQIKKEHIMNPNNPKHFVCTNCGASNMGELNVCLNCKTPHQSIQTEGISKNACPHCGFQNNPGDKFCTECGKHLEPVSVSQEVFCSNCGNQIAPGKKFCTNCGTRL